MTSIHRTMMKAGLVRDTNQRILGGVCSGLGQRFGVDPWAVRALFVLSLVLIPGSQILLYPVAWLLMPDEARAGELSAPTAALTPAAYPAPADNREQSTVHNDSAPNDLSLTKN